ncbi:MAG TPA: Flp pilus assembly protein CpaB, partial [Isosphaeraceae bacterium]
MRPQTILIVAMALVFGGSAAVGVYTVVKRSKGAAPAVERAPVVVAEVDIARGTTLSAEQLKLREFPKDLAPAGALTKLEDAMDRVAFVPLVHGEPVLESRLTPKGAGRGMAALIPKGMRASTIQTTNIAAGVAGFILPGNKVDVLLTMNDQGPEDPSGGGSTTTLLQNVEILAVDQRIEAPAENKISATELRSVTLLVTPDQAAELNLGQNRGTLHLSLRNFQDNEPAKTRPATVNDLRFRQEKPAPPAAAPPEPAGTPAATVALAAAGAAAAPAPRSDEPPPPRLVRLLRG